MYIIIPHLTRNQDYMYHANPQNQDNHETQDNLNIQVNHDTQDNQETQVNHKTQVIKCNIVTSTYT